MANRSDNFNRADGSLVTPSDGGSNWVIYLGTWSVSTNKCSCDTLVGSRGYVALETSSTVGKVSTTWLGGDVGIFLRGVDSNNLVLATLASTGSAPFKRVSGTSTGLSITGGSTTFTITSGDTMSMEVDASNNYIVKKNGVSQYTFTETSNATNTQAGYRSAATGANLDDFVFTDAGATNTAINPSVGNIAITGYAPTIAQTANQSITPNVGSLTITGYAPTVSQPQGINPSAGSLTITGYAPSITQTLNQFITPNVGSLSITGYTPSIAQTANQALTPSTGSLTITGYAPTVTQASGSLNIVPGVGTLTITGYAPTVAQSGAGGGAPDYSNKYLVRKGKQLIVFKNKLDALNALNDEEINEVEASTSTEQNNAPISLEIANKPIYDVNLMLQTLQDNEKALALVNQQKYQQFVRLYESWIEEEELEILLMAL